MMNNAVYNGARNHGSDRVVFTYEMGEISEKGLSRSGPRINHRTPV